MYQSPYDVSVTNQKLYMHIHPSEVASIHGVTQFINVISEAQLEIGGELISGSRESIDRFVGVTGIVAFVRRTIKPTFRYEHPKTEFLSHHFAWISP